MATVEPLFLGFTASLAPDESSETPEKKNALKRNQLVGIDTSLRERERAKDLNQGHN